MIAGTDSVSGALTYDIKPSFQKKEDVVTFLRKVKARYPCGTKLAIFWDNAASHRAKLVTEELRDLDMIEIRNVAYKPQFNGIEYVWSLFKVHFRKSITEYKLDLLPFKLSTALHCVLLQNS